MKWLLAAAAVAAIAVGAQSLAAKSNPAYRAAVHLAFEIGSRPAASGAELRAHKYVAKEFRQAGLETVYTPFTVPGKGGSRNVVGHYQGRHNCLKVVMAHIDTVPAAPGADDNASGVGILVALAPRLDRIRPYCDVWLAATGAEERPYTGHPDHLGSRRLVKYLRMKRSARRLRYALSVDMVGRGSRFQLRSPRAGTRPKVEGQLLRAGRQRDVTLRWLRDSSSGNSDHREFELVGLPAFTVQVWGGIESCWHRPCDTWKRLQPGSLDRVQDMIEIVLRRK